MSNLFYLAAGVAIGVFVLGKPRQKTKNSGTASKLETKILEAIPSPAQTPNVKRGAAAAARSFVGELSSAEAAALGAFL